MKTKLFRTGSAVAALRAAREQNESDMQWLQGISGRARLACEALTVAEHKLGDAPTESTVAEYVNAHREKALLDGAFCSAARLARPRVVEAVVARTREPLAKAWRSIREEAAARLAIEEEHEATRYVELGIAEGSISPALAAVRQVVTRAEDVLRRLEDFGTQPLETQLQIVSTLGAEACGE